jgi:hypothetical protein
MVLSSKLTTSRRNKNEYDTLTGRGASDVQVSFTGPSDVRHSVEVTAEFIYEAAALGVSALKNSGWADAIAPGTELEVQVREPATCHRPSCSRFVAGAMASRSAPTRR